MKEWKNDARTRKRYPRKEPAARSEYNPAQALLLERARREWERQERAQRARHFEEMTAR